MWYSFLDLCALRTLVGTKGHQCGDKLPSPSKTSSKHTKPPLLLLPSGKRPSSRTRYLLIKARGRLAFSGVSINQSLGNEPAHNSAFMPPKQCCNPAPIGRARQHHRGTVPPHHHPCVRFLSQAARDQRYSQIGAETRSGAEEGNGAQTRGNADSSPQHRTGCFGNP